MITLKLIGFLAAVYALPVWMLVRWNGEAEHAKRQR